MDPITTAVVAALQTAASNATTSAVQDAYNALKTLILRKWGSAAPIAKAVAALEADPHSKPQADVLAEKVAAVQAGDDPEIVQALQNLVQEMRLHHQGAGQVANIQFHMKGGSFTGIGAVQNVTAGTLNFHTPSKT